MSLSILFLTAQLPYPPRLGGALRNHGMITGLAGRHRVGLLSLLEEGQPDPATTPLVAICQPLVTLPAPPRTRAQRLRDLLAGQADMARRLWSDAYAAALREMVTANHFEVIHVGGLEMAPYVDVLRVSGFEGLIVFDNYNAEAALQRRIFEVDLRTPRRWHAAVYSFIQWRRLTRFETRVCRSAGHVLAVSGLDAQLLRGLKHDTPVSVIPNAIDVAAYQLDDVPDGLLPRPALVFTGKMDYRPNVDAALWFARDVLPRVQREVPGAHLAIVGQKPHARLAPLRGRADITITGAVDDIRPYVAAADVYVVPMRMGSGTRFKVLEAMAMQRAIVSTTLGAQGLDARSGRHLVVADGAGSFAEAVTALLRDDTRRADLGRSARAFVAEGYDWGRIIPRLEAIYESA